MKENIIKYNWNHDLDVIDLISKDNIFIDYETCEYIINTTYQIYKKETHGRFGKGMFETGG